MTPHGAIAVLVLVLTNAGTIIAAWVALSNMRHTIAKQNANRVITLERWGDEIHRYHRRLRDYLWELAEQGIIDTTRVDFAKFPPPPMPTINGDT